MAQRSIMERAGNLTKAQVEEILRLYPDTSTAELASRFGKPAHTIYGIAYRYGLQKSVAFKNSERSGRFQRGCRTSPGTEFKKGHTPHSKGKRQRDFMSEEAIQKTVPRRWKSGHVPHGTKFDGAITVRRVAYKNTGWVPYKFIRIGLGKWKFLHRHIWEQEYGQVAEGYNIVFKNGNTLDCKLDNLECISNAELAKRNRLSQWPAELRESIMLKNKLIRKINSYGKKSNHGSE